MFKLYIALNTHQQWEGSRKTYFMRIINPLQWRVTDNISHWNYICKRATNYCRQSCSKKCLEKSVNASYKKKGLYYPCLVTLVQQKKSKQLTIKTTTNGISQKQQVYIWYLHIMLIKVGKLFNIYNNIRKVKLNLQNFLP